MLTAVSIFGLIMGVLNMVTSRKTMGLWFWIGLALVVVSGYGLVRVIIGVGPEG
ncbi:MAG: hypothetical protein AAGK00_13285 [Pseudomonadota bacterium]